MVEEIISNNQGPNSDMPGLGGIARGRLSTKVGVSRQAQYRIKRLTFASELRMGYPCTRLSYGKPLRTITPPRPKMPCCGWPSDMVLPCAESRRKITKKPSNKAPPILEPTTQQQRF